MNHVTETIAAVKGTVAKGKEFYIVVTATGNQVWVPKHQFDPSHETITFEPKKVGDTYLDKAGVEQKLLKDQNQFVGSGKSSKVENTIKLFQELNKMGITPAISM